MEVYIEANKLTEREKTVLSLLYIDKVPAKEVANRLDVGVFRVKELRDGACRKIKTSITQLKLLSPQEIDKLIQETKLIRDIYSERKEEEKRIKEKTEKQLHLWQTVVTLEQKQLLASWFTRKSTYLFKKQHSIPATEINKLMKHLGDLLEVDIPPKACSIERLSYLDRRPVCLEKELGDVEYEQLFN